MPVMSKSSEQEIDYLNLVVYQLYQQSECPQGLYLALQVREITNQELDESHPQYAMALNNLGIFYLATGKYAEVEPLYKQAKERPFDLAEALFNMAYLCIATHRTDEAMAAIEQVFSFSSESQRLTYILIIQEHFETYLSAVLQYLRHVSEAVLASLDKVLQQKAIGAEALMTQRDVILEGRYSELAPKLQELTILPTRITRKILEGPRSECFESYNSRLAESSYFRRLPSYRHITRSTTGDKG